MSFFSLCRLTFIPAAVHCRDGKILPGHPRTDGSIGVVRVPQVLYKNVFRVRNVHRIGVRSVNYVHRCILSVIIRGSFPAEPGISVAGGNYI